jgi:hypothetical protein
VVILGGFESPQSGIPGVKWKIFLFANFSFYNPERFFINYVTRSDGYDFDVSFSGYSINYPEPPHSETFESFQIGLE